VTIETTGNPGVVVPAGRLDLSLDGTTLFTIRLRGVDDVNFSQSVEWPRDRTVQLSEARVFWWLPAAAWDEQLARWGASRVWEIGAVVDLKLRLETKTRD
jgi:hypothetical protein